MTMPERFPMERDILRPFALPDEQGHRLDLEQFRQERNLVLVFVKELTAAVADLMRELVERRGALVEEEAKVIVVVSGTGEHAATVKERFRLPFPVLSDETGRTLNAFCGTAAVYVTDKFREIYAAGHDDTLPSGTDVVEWLAHINRQCPE